MDDVEKLLKGTVEELDRLLNAKNVLAAPIEKEGATIIPLVSYGFGFGSGGGSDEKSGRGAGTGAGGGIKPVGAIVIDKDGARVEGVKGSTTSLIETIGNVAGRAIDASRGKKDAEK